MTNPLMALTELREKDVMDRVANVARLKTEREFFVRQRDAFRSGLKMRRDGIDVTVAHADRMAEIVEGIDAAIADWETGEIVVFATGGEVKNQPYIVGSVPSESFVPRNPPL